MVGSINWKIGDETELPFEDHQPNKTLHYINGYDKAKQNLCVSVK